MQAISNTHTTARIVAGQENTRAIKEDGVAAQVNRRALGDLSTNNRRPAGPTSTAVSQPLPAEILRSRAPAPTGAVVNNARHRTRPRVATTTRSVTSQANLRSRQLGGAAPLVETDDHMDEIVEDKENNEMFETVQAQQPKQESYSERMMRMGVPDIDAADAGDPQAATEYVVEIMEYMRSIEPAYMANANYITRHPEITWNSRSLLVNWMVEVHWRYKFYPETLFLAVNILDRYMAETPTPVPRNRLQLVGVASLVIAAKFEEIQVPAMEEFSRVTQANFSELEIIKMERQILYVLQFNLNFPSPLTFLRRISKAEEYDVPTRTVAKYLMEITVLHESFIQYTPSMVAAASTLLARRVLNKGPWDNTMEFYSNYTVEQLQPCVDHMIKFVVANPTDFRSVYKKYSSSKFLRASLFVEQELRRQGSA